jgi:hypothetical protein
MTTAPRAEETLSRTIQSYTDTGLPTPNVFADYGAAVPEGYPVTRRDTRVGGWPNFFLALSELVMHQPQADFYLMLQDDVVFCRNVGRYLETRLTAWDGGENQTTKHTKHTKIESGVNAATDVGRIGAIHNRRAEPDVLVCSRVIRGRCL